MTPSTHPEARLLEALESFAGLSRFNVSKIHAGYAFHSAGLDRTDIDKARAIVEGFLSGRKPLSLFPLCIGDWFSIPGSNMRGEITALRGDEVEYTDLWLGVPVGLVCLRRDLARAVVSRNGTYFSLLA